jgi:hypothetical protein
MSNTALREVILEKELPGLIAIKKQLDLAVKA